MEEEIDYNKMTKVNENTWSTNSDIYGFVIKLIDGYYEVYSFDGCFDDLYYEEKDTNLGYLQSKYGFKDLEK